MKRTSGATADDTIAMMRRRVGRSGDWETTAGARIEMMAPPKGFAMALRVQRSAHVYPKALISVQKTLT